MITLITGVPGAGKTLYCIAKLLRDLVGTTIEHGDPIAKVERRILTNINGLLLPHEKIEGGAAWATGKAGGDLVQVDGNKLGLNNWHEWCKPGDVICFDEVQKIWPLQASGSKVSPAIEGLETHRHMGVDFIVLTQHPMLVNSNLMRLVGRHLHVRRMGNMGLAIVYEWDSASKTLLYKNALAKSPFRYSKDVFKLYKSAEVHTKQKRSTPTLIFGVAFALAAMGVVGPYAFDRIGGRLNPNANESLSQKEADKIKAAAGPVVPLPGGPDAPTRPPVAPPASFASQVAQVFVEPEISGCMVFGEECRCANAKGEIVTRDRPVCEVKAGLHRGPVVDIGPDTPTLGLAAATGDFDTLRWMAERRGK